MNVMRAAIAEIESRITQLQHIKKTLLNLDGLDIPGTSKRGRHTLSASAKKRISLAQKARWAKWKRKQKT